MSPARLGVCELCERRDWLTMRAGEWVCRECRAARGEQLTLDEPDRIAGQLGRDQEDWGGF